MGCVTGASSREVQDLDPLVEDGAEVKWALPTDEGRDRGTI